MTESPYGVQGAGVRIDPTAPPAIARAAEPEPEQPDDQMIPVSEVSRLIGKWENAAETTLLRSDYQRGQRDATLACVNDLTDTLRGR